MPRRPDLPLESPQNEDCRRIHLWDAFAAPLESWRHSRTAVSGSPLPEHGRNLELQDFSTLERLSGLDRGLSDGMHQHNALSRDGRKPPAGLWQLYNEHGVRECPTTSTSGSDLDQGLDVPRRLFDERNVMPATDFTERSSIAF